MKTEYYNKLSYDKRKEINEKVKIFNNNKKKIERIKEYRNKCKILSLINLTEDDLTINFNNYI